MFDREILEAQQGIWINERWIHDAKLGKRLQVVVRPGEIRILPMPEKPMPEKPVPEETEAAAASEDPVLAVAGILSGEPPSAEEIERELYTGCASRASRIAMGRKGRGAEDGKRRRPPSVAR